MSTRIGLDELTKWALVEFREFVEDKNDLGDAIIYVWERKSKYRSNQKLMRGIREYLYEVKGLKEIPFRVDYYERIGKDE